MKTLVVHPYDPSTEFLREIYAHINCTIVRQRPNSMDEYVEALSSHDRIIGLGHGSPYGLFNLGWAKAGSYLLSRDNVELLEDKDNIYIWCHADQFVKAHNLKGYSSGMFISEVAEAASFGIKAPQEQVEVSNYGFAVTLGRILQKDPYLPGGLIHKRITRQYLDESDEIITFNNKRMIFN